MIRSIQIAVIALSLASSIHAENCITKFFSSFSFSDLTFTKTTPVAVKQATQLNLPEMKEREKVESLINKVFVDNDKTQVKPLIKSVYKYTKKSTTEAFATIINWALENDYHNIPEVVRGLSHRTLSGTYKNKRPFKYFLFIQAITYMENDVVEYLLPKLSHTHILEKDSTLISPLEYATQAGNQEAATIISEYIQKIHREQNSGWKVFGAFMGGMLWGFAAPRYLITYPMYYHTYYSI